MRKTYISPRVVAIELDATDQILESSYTDIGGTTDSFGVKRNFFFTDFHKDETKTDSWDEWEDDF